MYDRVTSRYDTGSSSYGSSSAYGSSSSYRNFTSAGSYGSSRDYSSRSTYGSSSYDPGTRLPSATARRYNPYEFARYPITGANDRRNGYIENGLHESRDEAGDAADDDPGVTSPRLRRSGAAQKKKTKTTVNGSVIRIRRNRNVSSSSSDSSSDEEQDEKAAKEPSPAPKEPTPPPKSPTPPPPPPPEDPLDVEERDLQSQLLLSLTLTITDEETIRQRLLEIKKTRVKRGQAGVERELLQAFEDELEAFVEPAKSKEDEEQALMDRIEGGEIKEVEKKDIQVRLQELFRHRRSALETTRSNILTHFEKKKEDTTSEMSSLDTSISEKKSAIDTLQAEIIELTVRKELLSSGIEKMAQRHAEQLEQVDCRRSEVESRIEKYTVVAQPKVSRQTTIADDELRELEKELECPVCMDISRPPIYQCEEGHIICSSCKPLLTQCPSCAKGYSNPVIRCRFAEKLSERYFKFVERFQEDGEQQQHAK